MGSVDARDGLEGLPVMLTVPAAAGVLGIGRTLAYQLAERFSSGDPTGLPVVRLGGCLRVPRWALIEYISHGRVDTDIAHIVRAEIDAQLDEHAIDTDGGTAAIATIDDDRALASVTRLTARRPRRVSESSTAVQLSLALES